MRLEKNLKNINTREKAYLEGDLICDCQNDLFYVLHSGKQKKGWFGSTYLVMVEKQIIIKAKCTNCGKSLLVYDSTIDSSEPKGTPKECREQFCIKDIDKFNINLKYNFYEENFNTDKYEMIFMYVKPENSDKDFEVFGN